MSEPADLPDQPLLLELVKMGDREAFERFADPYQRELHIHCYRMLGGFHDAEDVRGAGRPATLAANSASA